LVEVVHRFEVGLTMMGSADTDRNKIIGMMAFEFGFDSCARVSWSCGSSEFIRFAFFSFCSGAWVLLISV